MTEEQGGERRPLLGDLASWMPDDQNQRSQETEKEAEEVELTGCGATAACDPRRAYHRYLVLIVMCFLSFGSYFCYDNPAALQDAMERDLNIDTGTYMSLYSWYSWPNVVLAFFGGFLIDRVFGVRLGAIVFSIFVTSGQFIFAAGALFNMFWLMELGRFVFGIGGESLCVAQNTYAVNWFKGRELNMVFGLQLSFSRVGSTVNMNTMQHIYDAFSQFVGQNYTCLGITLFIGGAFCLFSLMCALVMWVFDKRACRILKRDTGGTGEKISITDVKDFSICVWLLCLICVAYYVTIFPFIGLGLVFFEMKFGYEPTNAGVVNSLVYIVSAAASPFFGFFIDKTGKNIFWVIGGILVTMGCHGLLAFSFINPYVAMVIMGFAYSVLASALWPMVSMVVPEHQLGTAYGLMQSVQNLGLGVIALVAGKLVDSSGYLLLIVFFLAWLCVALIGTVVLYLVDASRGGKMNSSARVRHREALEKETMITNVEEDPHV